MNESVIVRPSWIIPISLEKKYSWERTSGASGHPNGHHVTTKIRKISKTTATTTNYWILYIRLV